MAWSEHRTHDLVSVSFDGSKNHQHWYSRDKNYGIAHLDAAGRNAAQRMVSQELELDQTHILLGQEPDDLLVHFTRGDRRHGLVFVRRHAP